MQRRYTLGKAHKLCSQTAIDTLFATRREGCSMLAYPLRAVWADSPAGYAQQERVEFLISVLFARERGIRIFCWERPGCVCSTGWDTCTIF